MAAQHRRHRGSGASRRPPRRCAARANAGLGIVGIASVAIGLALRAERRSTIGSLTLDARALRIVLNVEDEAREVDMDFQQSFVLERLFCQRAPGSAAVVCRVDQDERSLWRWNPLGLSSLCELAGSPGPVRDEPGGLYLATRS